jgi:hypothetical protein
MKKEEIAVWKLKEEVNDGSPIDLPSGGYLDPESLVSVDTVKGCPNGQTSQVRSVGLANSESGCHRVNPADM